MSGSSLDGLDIAFVEFTENAGKWSYDILHADCISYSQEWQDWLKKAINLNAYEYQLLHARYGKYLGEAVNHFIEKYSLQYKVGLIASHGHTTFHVPHIGMTAQLGDGAALAAVTGLPVVSDLRALDVALGGQGAPIVPVGEKLLFPEYAYLLNIGGIANLSIQDNEYRAFDVCAANRVLNMLANDAGKEYDENGAMAATGELNKELLQQLGALAYYKKAAPKSLANSFGTEEVYPLVKAFNISMQDQLRTYTEHIAIEIMNAVRLNVSNVEDKKLLITGGGAFNTFLVKKIASQLEPFKVEVVVPNEDIVKYKEALIMALIGVLRWREESNVLHTVTGAKHNSVGGALWLGQPQ